MIKLNRKPDLRLLRQFGGLCVVFLGSVACWRLATIGSDSMAVAMLIFAAVAGLLGWLKPIWLRPVFVGWSIAAFPIGWMVSHTLLLFLFFGVFTPLGLLLRCLGKDSLNLRRRNVEGYWQQRQQQRDLSRYLRQY